MGTTTNSVITLECVLLRLVVLGEKTKCVPGMPRGHRPAVKAIFECPVELVAHFESLRPHKEH